MFTLGTKEKINVGSEMCLFSQTEIFTLWINSLQPWTRVKCLGFSCSVFFLQPRTFLFQWIILVSMCKRIRGKLPYVANL